MPLKIQCDQVKTGMYILGFGGSWLDHPFWRAKFLLETQEDLVRVRESGVPYVLAEFCQIWHALPGCDPGLPWVRRLPAVP